MSLIPAFELGLWNAWIIIVLSFLGGPILISLINKDAIKKFMTPPDTETAQDENLPSKIFPILSLATSVYSIFLPLKLGTLWFSVGLPICLLAIVMNAITAISFSTTPLDEPVTKGTYRISRHPTIFGTFILNLGIGIICASWVFMIYALVFILIMRGSVQVEENYCLERYSDAYRDYMNRTPRWIGIPKRT
jgi:protein-S-isoprenylcysteine O-methyltransferase Ste14